MQFGTWNVHMHDVGRRSALAYIRQGRGGLSGKDSISSNDDFLGADGGRVRTTQQLEARDNIDWD